VKEAGKQQKFRPLVFTPKTQNLILKLASDTKSWDVFEIQRHLKCTDNKANAIWKEVKKRRRELMLAVGIEIDDTTFKVKGLQNLLKTGVIYLVEHELYPGWIKCGMTVNMNTRLKTYNCSDPLKRFKFVTSKVVEDRRKAELMLINNLKAKSDLQSGEWFRISKDEALKIFDLF
jgi:hypothetical protein